MIVVAATASLTSCSDLLSTNKPDAVVTIPVKAARPIGEVRREVKEETGRLGGVRVGEDTTDPDKVTIEFMLPGKNLDAAVAMLERFDPEAVSTEVDVDETKLTEDTLPETQTGSDPTTKAKDDETGRVRLKVEIAREAESSGLLAVLAAGVLFFSVIGLATSMRWLFRIFGGRRNETYRPGNRRVQRPDLDVDPPTQETPLVPPQY